MFKIFVVALTMSGQIVGYGVSENEYSKEECGQHILKTMQDVVAHHKAQGIQVAPSGGCLPSADADALFKKMEQAGEQQRRDDSI